MSLRHFIRRCRFIAASAAGVGTAVIVSVCGGCASHSPAAGTSALVRPSNVAPVLDVTNLPGSIYDVTLKSSVVKMDRASVKKALLAVSDDGTIFAFDSSVPQVASLTPGKTMLLSATALRKITSVSEKDGVVFVKTGQ